MSGSDMLMMSDERGTHNKELEQDELRSNGPPLSSTGPY